jgi:hypothetical protein
MIEIAAFAFFAGFVVLAAIGHASLLSAVLVRRQARN